MCSYWWCSVWWGSSTFIWNSETCNYSISLEVVLLKFGSMMTIMMAGITVDILGDMMHLIIFKMELIMFQTMAQFMYMKEFMMYSKSKEDII